MERFPGTEYLGGARPMYALRQVQAGAIASRMTAAPGDRDAMQRAVSAVDIPCNAEEFGLSG